MSCKSSFLDERYVQICSEKTLQTNEQGFFLNFAEEIAKISGEKWIKSVFGKLKNDKDRVRCVYEDEKISEYVIEFLSRVQEVYRPKSAKVASEKQLEGDNFAKNQDFIKALAAYNQSIIKSLPNCVLSTLLRRSKVLISLQQYERALADLQICQKGDLINKGEIFAQIAICYQNLGHIEKAQIALNLAANFLSCNNTLIKSASNSTKATKNEQKTLPEISSERHKELKNASKKLTIKCSKELGRYVIANECIKSGEVLVVEEPYSACLLPEKFGTHCHHCFARLYSPVGCLNCSSVAFCDIKCRDLAFSTYHKYECKFLDLLIGSGMSILAHTALRMITQNDLNRSLNIYNNRDKLEVYSLCTNAHKRTAPDFLQRTLMAAFLLRILQKSGYFGAQRRDSVLPSESEYKIGDLLLFHLQMLQFNAHEIYETLQPAEHRFKGSKPAYIGVAVYPTVALFNHDCYPAITRFFSGRSIVVTSIRPLTAGETVAENYGPIFTWKDLQYRQRTLAGRYWFECKCRACVENWPMLKQMEEETAKRVKCPTVNCEYILMKSASRSTVKCPKCKKQVNLEENFSKLEHCEEQFELGLAYLDREEKDKTIATLCPALDLFHNISSPPHRLLHLAQESLRLALADSGNTHRCPSLSSKHCTQ